MKISINKEILKNISKKNNKSKNIYSLIIIFLLIIVYLVLNYNSILFAYDFNKDKNLGIENTKVILGGEVVGIKLLATGVLVMGLDREDTILQVGDIILKVNEQKVESNIELLEFARNSQGNELTLQVKRKEEIFNINILPIKDEISGEYKLGLWVKDSSAGVGTISFYLKDTDRFAALGHGVTETKENYVLPINSGGITTTNIYSIRKGVAKVPGELKGTITNEIIGDIMFNTENGIYGSILNKELIKNKNEIEILIKEKIKEGEASIFCTLDDNKVVEYKVQIQKILLNSEGNKNMVIKITDENLINKTGGIVQGMSGSPIVQNGKLIGAITHVFLNDPTRGYGVFVENMISEINKIN